MEKIMVERGDGNQAANALQSFKPLPNRYTLRVQTIGGKANRLAVGWLGWMRKQVQRQT
jgi:hypothetical protein